jgi:hypothetical protein
MNMKHLLAECELTRKLNKAYNVKPSWWITSSYSKSNYVKHNSEIIKYLQNFNKLQSYK